MTKASGNSKKIRRIAEEKKCVERRIGEKNRRWK